MVCTPVQIATHSNQYLHAKAQEIAMNRTVLCYSRASATLPPAPTPRVAWCAELEPQAGDASCARGHAGGVRQLQRGRRVLHVALEAAPDAVGMAVRLTLTAPNHSDIIVALTAQAMEARENHAFGGLAAPTPHGMAWARRSSRNQTPSTHPRRHVVMFSVFYRLG